MRSGKESGRVEGREGKEISLMTEYIMGSSVEKGI